MPKQENKISRRNIFNKATELVKSFSVFDDKDLNKKLSTEANHIKTSKNTQREI